MISSGTVGGLFRATARRCPEQTAIVFPDSRQSYAELQRSVDAWSQRLIDLGVGQGDHVGLSMTNAPDFIQLLFAICSIGAVAVPLNPRYRSSELAHVVQNSDVSIVIVGNPPVDDLDLMQRLVEALPGLKDHRGIGPLLLAEAPRVRRVVALAPSPCAGVLGLDDLDSMRAVPLSAEALTERYARTRVRDAALIMYTSGTTARPKGAVLSHEAIVRTAVSLAYGRYFLTPEDRLWDPLPLFHMSGLLPLLATVSAGCTFLCMPRVDAAAGLRTMRKEKATVAFLAFAQLAMDLITQPGYQPSDLQTLRIVHTGGVPEVLAKVQAAFPSAVQVNPYGCTEAGGMCATSELTDTPEQRAVLSGRPIPDWRSAWSTRATSRCGPLPAARSSYVAIRCSTGTTTARKPRLQSWTPMAGSTPEIWVSWTPTAASATSRGSRTC